MENGHVVPESTELHWLPFRPSGLYLHEPLSGALVRGWSGEDDATGEGSGLRSDPETDALNP
jgi:hypothetical protein